ncbi:MAG TPA: alpha/beta hydrolase [Polyangiaceae bacterium]|nr:alpha/beta hydrolase [Polyangiaceae bacterium]
MEIAYRETTIASADGTKLHLHTWRDSAPPSSEVLIVHGYAEHGGRYQELARYLARAGLAVTALDLRGHGRSEGQRGYVERFDDYHADLAAALMTLDSGRPHFLLAHSMGALLAFDFIARLRPPLAGLVVTNPYLALTTAPPQSKLVMGKLAARVLPRLSLPSGLSPEGLSRDPACVEAYRSDPLVFTTANAAWFRESNLAMARVRDVRSLSLPLFYAYSLADPVARSGVNQAFAEQLLCSDKTIVVREGLHEILNETDRAALFEMIRDWILARAAQANPR